MSDLKPCLACGDEKSPYRTQDPSLWFYVLCPECGTSGPVHEEASHAVNAWNDLPRRSNSDGLRDENARLRAALALIRGGTEIARGDGQHEWSPLDEWQAYRIADDALSPVETDPKPE